MGVTASLDTRLNVNRILHVKTVIKSRRKNYFSNRKLVVVVVKYFFF